MPSVRKQQVLSVADFRYVSIHCSKCNTTLVRDFKNETKSRSGYFAPRECPICGQDFDSAVTHLDALQQVYGKLSAAERAFTFSGEPVDEFADPQN